MVAIVAGNGLGLFNASLNTLGGAGVLGQGGNLGRAGGKGSDIGVRALLARVASISEA